MFKQSSWQAAYDAVVRENDTASLPLKISEAQSACKQRRSFPVDEEEDLALAFAEAVLRMLRGEWFR